MAYMTSSNDPFWDDAPVDDPRGDIKSRRNYAQDTLEVSIPAELMARVTSNEQLLKVLQNQILDQMAMSQKQMYSSYPQSYHNQQAFMTTHHVIGGAGGGGGGGSIGSAGSNGGSHLPMGISQWAEHGKRHGYWDYFKEQVLREFQTLQKKVDQYPIHEVGVSQMVFGGTMVPGYMVKPGVVEKTVPKITPEDTVKVDGKIEIGDKVSIKKHEPIIVK